MVHRRRVLQFGAGLLAGLAGCASGPDRSTADEGPGTDAPPSTDGSTTTDARSTTDTPAHYGHGDCETPTPEPVPDLNVYFRADQPRRVTVTVTRADGSGDPVFREEFERAGDETVRRYDVFPADDTYRIEAELPGGETNAKEMDVERNDRYGIVTVSVQGPDTVYVERLGVHPEATPTPCPE